MLLLAATLFFSEPAPLDMPRAEAYLVREKGVTRLEDRFNTLDLWTSRSVLGRWLDEDGRVLTVAAVEKLPPKFSEATKTRLDYGEQVVSVEPKNLRQLRESIVALSPIEIAEKPVSPDQEIRGYAEVKYWQGVASNVVVCSYRFEKDVVRYLAIWELIEGDDFAEQLKVFESDFLGDRDRLKKLARGAHAFKSEAEALRADAHHSVTNYTLWHWTDAKEFTVLDDLPSTSSFVSSLTNELPRLRTRYAKMVPSPLNGSNVLCVARIFRNRTEYLDCVGEELSWTAAYWSPLRRELVAHLPDEGEASLLKTIRHEAFHQYLSYATAMASASPWFNEGYAEYVEDDGAIKWGFDPDFEALAELIPGLLQMDYDEFYAGTDVERKLKYNLARSLAEFIEKGAPLVRLDPFAKLKRTYIETLIDKRDMRLATTAAFESADKLALFITEWKRYWKNQ